MSRIPSDSNLPNGLSAEYWSTWTPIRKGASVSESVDKNVGEEWIGGWDGIGLYEGNNKVPSYQILYVHLTNQRLILIPDINASSSLSSSSSTSVPSLQCHLSYVRQTEFYAGFMRSSAKITLTLGPAQPQQSQSQLPSSSSSSTPASASTSTEPNETSRGTGWTCNICGYVNTLHANRTTPLPESKCALCGIPYSTSKLSVSGPPSRSTTPAPSTSASTTTSTAIDTPPADIGSAQDPTGTEEEDLVSCPACTFLNSSLLPHCEICSTPLPKKKNSAQNTQSNKPGNGSLEGGSKAETNLVRLSFRRGGEKEVYKRLKAVLSDKAWERGLNGSSSLVKPRDGDANGIEGLPRAGAGIDGILQQIDLNSKSHSNHISEAFADLEALMLRAGEMVRLAQSLNSKLTTQLNSSTTNQPKPTEEETTMIRSSLVQLGLNSPAVTKEMIRDEQRYHQGLAKELGELLTGRNGEGLMVGRDGRGVIALDEVWGLWMRARGVSLLPPSTLISILPFLPQHTSPSISSLVLPSSLQVLHTPTYSSPAILSRTLDRLNPSTFDEGGTEKSFTLLEFASIESLPIGLSREFIEILEKQHSGGLVRDDQGSMSEGGVRWYRDIISGWPVQNM
ncbi:ESCRT-II complex subunit VPS36 [Kwoniella mangroviensis CBS 10435]|uniref:Vacuolar protein-sorting-associated protein 36 n=1 Tax=Kwoniella mangroviensis CBS 10435 TaxID=1331196 RepID=A0A1B9IYF2_9TREE|nr:ESCRT-II complex subunit VPS36 [Kwoniella mangroviensis CBS 10435]